LSREDEEEEEEEEEVKQDKRIQKEQEPFPTCQRS